MLSSTISLTFFHEREHALIYKPFISLRRYNKQRLAGAIRLQIIEQTFEQLNALTCAIWAGEYFDIRHAQSAEVKVMDQRITTPLY